MEHHDLLHRSQESVFIPYYGITNNIDIQVGDIVTTCDFIDMEIVSVKYVHILTEEAKVLINTLYKKSLLDYLGIWYRKSEGVMSSMIFLHLTLKEKKDD